MAIQNLNVNESTILQSLAEPAIKGEVGCNKLNEFVRGFFSLRCFGQFARLILNVDLSVYTLLSEI